jgi:hypothetical protein
MAVRGHCTRHRLGKAALESRCTSFVPPGSGTGFSFEGLVSAAGELFYEPYSQEPQVDIAGRSAFVLARVPDDAKIFRSGEPFVAACSDPGGER